MTNIKGGLASYVARPAWHQPGDGVFFAVRRFTGECPTVHCCASLSRSNDQCLCDLIYIYALPNSAF